MATSESDPTPRRSKGFRRAGQLVAAPIRAAGEKRGFAVSRLLTHWPEIAGARVAEHTRPVEIRYGREGLGATLTLLTTGAHAPTVEMQKEALRTRVNACYGYAAISRIRITQTSASGFAEGRALFDPAPPVKQAKKPPPEQRDSIARTVAPVSDATLRAALETLGANVLSKTSN